MLVLRALNRCERLHWRCACEYLLVVSVAAATVILEKHTVMGRRIKYVRPVPRRQADGLVTAVLHAAMGRPRPGRGTVRGALTGASRGRRSALASCPRSQESDCGVMPRGIAVLMFGPPLVATSLVTAPCLESIGYVVNCGGFAYADVFAWRHAPPAAVKLARE
jgi:hypothetical protein